MRVACRLIGPHRRPLSQRARGDNARRRRGRGVAFRVVSRSTRAARRAASRAAAASASRGDDLDRVPTAGRLLRLQIEPPVADGSLVPGHRAEKNRLAGLDHAAFQLQTILRRTAVVESPAKSATADSTVTASPSVGGVRSFLAVGAAGSAARSSSPIADARGRDRRRRGSPRRSSRRARRWFAGPA